VDVDLRRLERKWRETGDVEDEAALLRGRLHTGDLDLPSLRIAAFCGHEAAVSLLEVPLCTCGATRKKGLHTKRCQLHPQPMSDTKDALRRPKSLKQWSRAFDLYGPAATGRAGVAVARLVATEEGWLEIANESLSFVEDWLLCPCEDHWEAVHLLTNGLGEPTPAIRRARQNLHSLPKHGPSRSLFQVVWGARDRWSQSALPFSAAARLEEAVSLARDCVAESRVRRAIFDEVVPWALGHGDPMRERSTTS